MGKELSLIDYETFMGCEYAEKERECLKLSECGLRGLIYELGES